MRFTAFLFIFTLVLAAAGSAVAQSRRVPPGSGESKPNRRETIQTPTPEPTPPPDAEVDGEVVSVETKLVTIPVRIIDRKGRFVGGLSRENFSVFENDVEQKIEHFSNEAQPFTVALVLDMSYSAKFKADVIQAAAIAFIDQLRPTDRVMVVSFDEEVHLLCEPTSDRNVIYRAIRSTRIATGTSLYEAVDLTMNDRLRDIDGRKAIVLFTDGVDTTSRRSHDLENLRDAMELDALIYPIRYDTFEDVQAMKGKPVINLPASRPGTPPISPSGGSMPTGIPGPVIATPSEKGTTPEEYARAAEYLDQLAARTGGRVYVADSVGNMNAAYRKIASELREFYSLGYYPGAEHEPGKNVRVRVRVDRRDVAVKARTSYVVNRKRGR